MKLLVVASVSFLLLAPVAAHGQHSLGMHSHSGTGGDSACGSGRFDRFIKLYPLDQRGDLDHKVSSNSESAKAYFNQGLTFLYGFDSESALRSFYQASLADTKLAMAHWGVALAAGGDLNIPIDDPCMVLAIKHSTWANQLLGGASAAEKLYINALAKRYATDSDVSRRDTQQLSVYYMLEMKSVYEQLRDKDPDAGALYAYSLMNLRPWLWWTTSGQPSAEITEALRALDDCLQRFPNHIGLNHIKIHALEEGPVAGAGRARAAAELLDNKAPSITPHLRHMPAHTFLLLGEWDRVVAANRRAVDADQPWAATCGDPAALVCNQLLVGHYYSHDMLFLDVGYNNQGDWPEVEKLYKQLESNVLKFVDCQPGLEHYLTTRVAMMVHFGKWQMLADLPPPRSGALNPSGKSSCPPPDYKLAKAMAYFGRAMGRASLPVPLPTDDDLKGFQQAQDAVQSAGIGWGNNSAADILKVLRWRLLERIARKKGLKEASKQFALLAVETEDLLAYDEPPGWYLSSRETYGASLFLDEKYQQAEAVFREDLKRHPNNSRSLFGLWQALLKQPGSPGAQAAKDDFYRQWKSSILPEMQDM
jgi:tetratricopeptide (TPR) repeat protein